MGGGKSKGKSKSKSGSHAHSMHIKRGHKGGFIAVHHSESGDPAEDQNNPIANMNDLHAHLDSAMGDQPAMEPAAPPAAAAGPAAGPAQAPPAGM